MNRRGSGVLLHITSLPSAYGIGDLGPAAQRFLDILAGAGQRYWQILPLNPTFPAFGNSPYQSNSAFAGNTWLISPEQMVADGFLDAADIADPPRFPVDRVDYPRVIDYKNKLFDRGFERFRERGRDYRYEEFSVDNASWLDDYALFVALKEHFAGRAWGEWPVAVRDREQEPLENCAAKLAERILREKFLQYVFDRQWKRFKDCCRARHVQVIGDIPFYVTYDSADTWSNPGTSRSTSPTTAPIRGQTRDSSNSTSRGGRLPSRVYHRISSARPGNYGETLSTAGRRTGKSGFRGGRAGSSAPSLFSTGCGSIISGGSSSTGRSRPVRRRRRTAAGSMRRGVNS